MRIYINGVIDNEITPAEQVSIHSNNQPVRFGSDYNNTDHTNCLIQLPRIWNVERTPTQIADNMNTVLGSATGLLAEYDFDATDAGGRKQIIDNTGNTTNSFQNTVHKRIAARRL